MKQARRIFTLLLAVVMTAVLLTGCVSTTPQEITVEDLTITLPGHFRNMATNQAVQEAAQDMVLIYGYMDITLVGIREDFSLFGADKPETLADYAQLIIDKNQMDAKVETVNGLTVFELTQANEKESYTYLAAVFESSGAYWLLQAGCTTDHFAGNRSSFLEYFSSVKTV